MRKTQYLIRFLKEHNILYVFFDTFIEMNARDINNAAYQRCIKVIEENYDIETNFIARAFSWFDTKQGATFWVKINNKFVRWWKDNVK